MEKVRRVMDEVFSDHGGIPKSHHSKMSKKASSTAATGILTGKPNIS